MVSRLDALADSDIRGLDEVWISLVNKLVRSLLGDNTNGADTAKARRLQLHGHIRANLSDPRLSPTKIAEALHV